MYPDQDSADEAQGGYLSYPDDILEGGHDIDIQLEHERHGDVLTSAGSAGPSYLSGSSEKASGRLGEGNNNRAKDIEEARSDSKSSGGSEIADGYIDLRLTGARSFESSNERNSRNTSLHKNSENVLHQIQDNDLLPEPSQNHFQKSRMNNSSRRIVVDLLSSPADNLIEKSECRSEDRLRKTIQVLVSEKANAGVQPPSLGPTFSELALTQPAETELKSAETGKTAAQTFGRGLPIEKTEKVIPSTVESRKGDSKVTGSNAHVGPAGEMSDVSDISWRKCKSAPIESSIVSRGSSVSNKTRSTIPDNNGPGASSREEDVGGIWLAALAANSFASAGFCGTFSLRSPLISTPTISASPPTDSSARSPIPTGLLLGSLTDERICSLPTPVQAADSTYSSDSSLLCESLSSSRARHSKVADSKFVMTNGSHVKRLLDSPKNAPSRSPSLSPSPPLPIPLLQSDKTTAVLQSEANLQSQSTLPMSVAPRLPSQIHSLNANNGKERAPNLPALPGLISLAANTFSPSWFPPPSPRAHKVLPEIANDAISAWLLQTQPIHPEFDHPKSAATLLSLSTMQPEVGEQTAKSVMLHSDSKLRAVTAEGLVGPLFDVLQAQKDTEESITSSTAEVASVRSAKCKDEHYIIDLALKEDHQRGKIDLQSAERRSKLVFSAETIIAVASEARLELMHLTDDLKATLVTIDSELGRLGCQLALLSNEAASTVEAVSLVFQFPCAVPTCSSQITALETASYVHPTSPKHLPKTHLVQDTAAGRIHQLERMVSQLSEENSFQVKKSAHKRRI